MKKTKETEEEITWEDFKTYLPKHDFDKKQIDFFQNALDYIVHRKNTTKVSCFCGRCGIGKSTMIHIYIGGKNHG